MVVTKLDTPKSGYRERTGAEWLVLGLCWGLEFTLKLTLITNSNTNPNTNTNTNPNTNTSSKANLALKLTTRFQYFLGNLILEYPV